jgi:opacity protein-like surface antigen
MRRPKVAAVSLGLLLACGGTAHAQSWEVSFLAGYAADAGLDRRAPELAGLDVRGGFTLGAQVGRSLGARWGVEVLWTQQHTALQPETADGKASLFDFTIDGFHANAIHHFAAKDAALRPFVLAGLGASYLSGGGLPSETKLSWAVGGGVKYDPWESIGFRGQVRYKPVILADSGAGDVCTPFGFCQGWLNQLDLTGGLVLRF